MNQRILTTTLACLLAITGCKSLDKTMIAQDTITNTPVYWQDLSVYRVNAEQPRATFIAYDSADKLSADDYASSPYYKLLSGDWKFNWSANPSSVPVGFYTPGYNVTGWDTLPVPGDWQMYGYDYPIYTNIEYPFPKNRMIIRPALIALHLQCLPVGKDNRYFCTLVR